MTNIRLKGGKEIDLLAVNPRSGEKYHVESRVGTSRGFKIRLHDTYTKNGRAHRIGLDFFHKQKFNHPTVVKKINEIFGSTEYRKILVVWDVQEKSVVEQAKKIYGIEVWFLQKLLMRLIAFAKDRGAKGSRDDIMRIVEMFALMGY